MSLAVVDQIAKAVLYEGYMLYPYRPSAVKNQQRWNFGVLYPRAYSDAQKGTDAWMMQTEVLVQGTIATQLDVKVRFLQLVNRSLGRVRTTLGELTKAGALEFDAVPTLAVDDRILQPWQEAIEREVSLPALSIEQTSRQPFVHSFSFPPEESFEEVRNLNGNVVGVIIRERAIMNGAVEVSVTHLKDDVFKVRVIVRNLATDEGTSDTRETAVTKAMCSTHTVLIASAGEFLSAIDPPESGPGTTPLAAAISQHFRCLLASKVSATLSCLLPSSCTTTRRSHQRVSVIFFDGTEIDEILSLRIMTLTDEEKREMRESDTRPSDYLERTESLPVDQLMKLGTVFCADCAGAVTDKP